MFKFLLVALAFGLVVAEMTPMNEEDKRKAGMAMKVLTMDVKDMVSCQSDSDCAAHPNKSKCSAMFKLCRPAELPAFQAIEGDCSDDNGCKPMRRCMNGKCHFSGPKACMSNSDCLQGVSGMQYECKELAKTAPGMRCYPKCTDDSMCTSSGRMPAEFSTKIGCCQGFCQKKAACM